jgi:hypothetical protein
VARGTALRHLLLSIALWATYASYWRVVLSRGVEREATLALLLLFFFVVLQFSFTQAWIAHNQRLSRRHAGRRARRPPPRPPAEVDFVGRRILLEGALEEVQRAPLVVIHVENGTKRFEAVRAPAVRLAGKAR